MCSIIGSRDLSKLKELFELNKDRGAKYSATIKHIDPNLEDTQIHCEIIESLWCMVEQKLTPNCYVIIHLQIPTSTTKQFIQPAINVVIEDLLPQTYRLYHNGILKTSAEFDTKEFLDKLGNNPFSNIDVLQQIKGSFSCLLTKDNGPVWIFRNSLAPLFVDDDLNISSRKFDDSVSTTAGIVYQLDYLNNYIIPTKLWNDTSQIYEL